MHSSLHSFDKYHRLPSLGQALSAWLSRRGPHAALLELPASQGRQRNQQKTSTMIRVLRNQENEWERRKIFHHQNWGGEEGSSGGTKGPFPRSKDRWYVTICQGSYGRNSLKNGIWGKKKNQQKQQKPSGPFPSLRSYNSTSRTIQEGKEQHDLWHCPRPQASVLSRSFPISPLLYQWYKLSLPAPSPPSQILPRRPHWAGS